MDQKLTNVLGKAAAAWRDVMSIYAGAMCSAQILEGELVQVLSFLRVGSGELKGGNHFDWAYEHMTRMKPIEVLKWIRGGRRQSFARESGNHQEGTPRSEFSSSRILSQIQPCDECRTVYAGHLKTSEDRIESERSFNSLQPLRGKLEMQLDLSADRRIVWENSKQFIEAIASFYDE
jgi:hypothetical protein